MLTEYLERLTRRHRAGTITIEHPAQTQPTQAQPAAGEAIQPAEGKAKTRLETNCQTILGEDTLTLPDIDQFARNMVELLGGTRDEFGELASNPLKDVQRSATLVVKSHDRYHDAWRVVIKLPGNREVLDYDDFGGFLNLRVDYNKDGTYYSYYHNRKITPEESVKSACTPDIQKAKPFLQKVFGAYQTLPQAA